MLTYVRRLLLLPPFFLSLIFTASSQDYESLFGETETSWNVAYIRPDIYSYDSLYSTEEFVVNEVSYMGINIMNHLDGYLREDTVTGKAWYMSDFEQQEKLIMDLGLNVGETFAINRPYSEPDSIVSVDSVYYIDGKKHVRLNYELHLGDNEKLTFIEGVGPNAGITFQKDESSESYIGIYSYLLCSYKDGDQIHTNSANSSCSVSIVDGLKDAISWSQYTDPSGNYTTLSFESMKGRSLNLEVVDVTGRPVRTITDIKTGQVNIEKENLSPGLYIFQLKEDGKHMASGRLIMR